MPWWIRGIGARIRTLSRVIPSCRLGKGFHYNPDPPWHIACHSPGHTRRPSPCRALALSARGAGAGLAQSGTVMRTLILLATLLMLAGCANPGPTRAVRSSSPQKVPTTHKMPTPSQRNMLHDLQKSQVATGRTVVKGALVR